MLGFTEQVQRVSLTGKRTVFTTDEAGLRWYWHLAAFCLAAVLLISRRPDAILHAQFFAEDGHVFFADAYNLGWLTSCFRAYSGYFVTLPRLAAGLALWVPLAWAPAVMNAVGLIFQALPVTILLSSRMGRLGSRQFRAVLAFLYLAIPNSKESLITVTCVQWHLAPATCLLLVSAVPPSRLMAVFDALLYAICGLTGPFSLLLAPIALLMARLKRERWRWVPVAILTVTGAIQVYAFLFIAPRTLGRPLDASFEMFARILAGHVYVGALLGSNGLASLGSSAWLLSIAAAGTLLVAYCFCHATTEMRLFLLFAATALVVSLISPGIELNRLGTAWDILAGAASVRYWLIPGVAFLWVAAWYVFGPQTTHFRQSIGGSLLLLMVVGMIREWQYPAYPDQNFTIAASTFENSPAGTETIIREVPSGWTLQLVKH